MKQALSLLALPGLAYAAVQGFDISHYQPSVNYAGAYSSGARFVMIKNKATEGTTYIDPSFSTHYGGATSAGLIRGGYHFATPDTSSGSAQATYFLAHGGGWSGDGITLPGMLDMEYNPYGSTCYGLSASSMCTFQRLSSGAGSVFFFCRSYIPASWEYQSFWQNSDSYSYGGDSDIWNGSEDNLVKFASG
ncbi:hypothetical protein AOCH_002297 [Aspergillus ochraceoroseus]|uniref:Lysozyme n=1 Tax=Aspergillus ochraceoroseus TaxID=138278 RepID=A0A0F8UUL4_9EURO|nr:hypothetical protein AOCH_002297 [Aspergillus ochraceoroseus]